MLLIKDNMLPLDYPTVIAIGNFDGAHIGHTKLFDSIKAYSKQMGCRCIVWSFETHPENILNDTVKVKSITTLEEKTEILESMGIDCAYYADFNKVRHLSPESFVEEILIKKFNAKHVVCGFNFTFAAGGLGNADILTRLLEEKGISTSVIPPIICGEVVVSSTFIRYLIESGDMEQTRAFLGRHFFITFPVVTGNRLGRCIGAPTINQNFPPEHIIPKKGVYAVKVAFDGKVYNGVSNVGTRPTVSSEDLVNCETHILDFSGELVGKEIRVLFVKRLRDEQKFSSVDELRDKIESDIKEARAYFENSSL